MGTDLNLLLDPGLFQVIPSAGELWTLLYQPPRSNTHKVGCKTAELFLQIQAGDLDRTFKRRMASVPFPSLLPASIVWRAL